MNIIPFLILNYFLYTIAIIIFYLIGITFKVFLLKANSEKINFEQIFTNLLIGVTFFVVAFSCYRADFKTINIGIVILSILLFFEYKKTLKCNNKINFYDLKIIPSYKYLILIFPLQLLFIFINIISKINWGADFPFYEHSNDYVYYNALSRSLAETGFENFYTAEKYLEPIKYSFCSEYHYFDLWLNAGISFFTNSNYELTSFFISYPLLSLISTIGLLAIMERFNKITFNHVILAFLLFHISQIHLPFYNNFYYLNTDIYRLVHFGGAIPAAQELKLIPYYPFVIAAILKILDKYFVMSSILLLMLIFVYTSAIPIVLGIIIIIILYGIYSRKYITKNEPFFLTTKICFYTIFTFAIYFGFYYFLKGDGITVRDGYDINLFNLDINKIRINIIVLSTFQIIILNLPLILIITYYFLTYKVNRIEWLLLLLLLSVNITGILSWALICNNADSVQLLGNNFCIIYLFSATLLIGFLSKIDREKNNLLSFRLPNIIGIFTIIFLLFCCSKAILSKFQSKEIFLNMHSNRYKNKVKEICSNKTINPIGVFIKGPKDYTTWINRLSPTYFLSTFLTYIPECYITINISTFNIPKEAKTELEKEREDKMIQCLFFEVFLNKQKNELKFTSYEKSQIDFINYYQIDYVLTSKNAILPKSIIPLVKNKVCDSISGECFYLLDRNKIN